MDKLEESKHNEVHRIEMDVVAEAGKNIENESKNALKMWHETVVNALLYSRKMIRRKDKQQGILDKFIVRIGT